MGLNPPASCWAARIRARLGENKASPPLNGGAGLRSPVCVEEVGGFSASGVGSHKRAIAVRLGGVWKRALVHVLPWDSLTVKCWGSLFIRTHRKMGRCRETYFPRVR